MISITVFISLFFIKVKELGLYGMNCSCLARDAQKMFEVYWMLAEPGMDQLPSKFPENLSADYSMSSPAHLPINGTSADVFFAVSFEHFLHCHLLSYSNHVSPTISSTFLYTPLSHTYCLMILIHIPMHCFIPTVSFTFPVPSTFPYTLLSHPHS